MYLSFPLLLHCYTAKNKQTNKKKKQNFKIHGSKITRLQEKVDKFTII